MSLLIDAPPDVQLPRLIHLPPNVVTSAAVEALEFAEEAAGLILDPWQRWCVEHALAERSDGQWAAFEVGIICPRQNGKNVILLVIQLACIYLFGDRTVVHSAHKFDTSVEHFQALKALLEGSDDLAELLYAGDKSFITANGKEMIRFRTGQRILFKARTKGGSRGFTGDKVFLDEAYDLPASAVGAMIPTLSTRPNPQVYYTSSAPHFTSTVLHSLRARGVADDPTDQLFYAEWGNVNGVASNDVEAIRQANPGVRCGRISEEYILREIRTFAGTPELVEQHFRERLGIASIPSDGAPLVKLPADKWLDSVTDRPPTVVPGDLAMAYDVVDGWASVSIAVGTLGQSYVECIRHQAGSGWLPAQIVELVERWSPTVVGLDGGCGPAVAALGEIREAMQAAGLDADLVKPMTSGEYKSACGAFHLAVKDGKVVRPSVPPDQLGRAGDHASERVIGDAFVWDRRTATVPISPLVSASIARALLPTEAPKGPPKLARLVSL